MKGYLSHPVLSRQMVAEFEKLFEEATGIELVNPFVDVERETDANLTASEAGDYTSVDSVKLVELDLDAVYDCSFMVAFITGQRSYGTIMEIVYASRANIPVYIICTNGHETHPWLQYHATKMFKYTEQFIEFMQENYSDN